MKYPYIKLWAGMTSLMICRELATPRSVGFFFPLFSWGGGIQRGASLEGMEKGHSWVFFNRFVVYIIFVIQEFWLVARKATWIGLMDVGIRRLMQLCRKRKRKKKTGILLVCEHPKEKRSKGMYVYIYPSFHHPSTTHTYRILHQSIHQSITIPPCSCL